MASGVPKPSKPSEVSPVAVEVIDLTSGTEASPPRGEAAPTFFSSHSGVETSLQFVLEMPEVC